MYNAIMKGRVELCPNYIDIYTVAWWEHKSVGLKSFIPVSMLRKPPEKKRFYLVQLTQMRVGGVGTEAFINHFFYGIFDPF